MALPEIKIIAYAQNAEDVVLCRAFDGVVGTYVDVGAGDPVIGSLTCNLYKRGWSGLNIEPIPHKAEALKIRTRDKLFEGIAGKDEGESQLEYAKDCWGMATVDKNAKELLKSRFTTETISVKRRTLHSLMTDFGIEPGFEFLKIDVEGFETEVIEGANLQFWQPRVLVIEATIPGTSQLNPLWLPYLKGYKIALFDGLNMFLVRNGDPIIQKIAIPANVFDKYVHHFWLEHMPALKAITDTNKNL